jgi:hypothetical protein
MRASTSANASRFTRQGRAQDLPVLRFGGTVVARGTHLEAAHQFFVDVAYDERLGHLPD